MWYGQNVWHNIWHLTLRNSMASGPSSKLSVLRDAGVGLIIGLLQPLSS